MNKIKFFLLEGARPSFGNEGGRLAAHTAAFLALSGIADGEAVNKDAAIKVLGPTAVSYHCKLGNFSKSGTLIKLTDTGREFFTKRGAPNNDLFAAYQEILMKGEPHPLVPSSPAVIKPLELAAE